MIDNILNNTKKVLGIDASYTQFDPDITMYINSTFSTLSSFGIGPTNGVTIDEETTWDDLRLHNDFLNSVKTYIGLKVKLLFDPPSTSFHLESMKQQIAEIEWRMSVAREGLVYGSPVVDDGGVIPPSDGVYDGGTPSGGSSDVYTPIDGVYDGGTP